jgi:hypothetical protein
MGHQVLVHHHRQDVSHIEGDGLTGPRPNLWALEIEQNGDDLGAVFVYDTRLSLG